MYANDAVASDEAERDELDALIAQVWERALEEAPQDQAQRGDATDFGTPQLCGISEPVIRTEFVSPTARTASTTAAADAMTPTDESHNGFRFAAAPFPTHNQSPVCLMDAGPHSQTNNTTGYNVYAPFVQRSPLTTTMGGKSEITVPATGAYTQSHILMKPGTNSAVAVTSPVGPLVSPMLAGVEEEMLILQSQQPHPSLSSPFYAAPPQSPFEGSGTTATAIANRDASLHQWSAPASHCTPITQGQPATWASPLPRPSLNTAARCMTPPDVRGLFTTHSPSYGAPGPAMMSSIAAAAAAASSSVKDPSPSQRRLPPGSMSHQGPVPAVRPQPRLPLTPTMSGGTPLQGASMPAGLASMSHYTSPGGVARTGSPSFPQPQPVPFFTTPSRPSQMPRNVSFTTSPLHTAEYQGSGRPHAHSATASGNGAANGNRSHMRPSGASPHRPSSGLTMTPPTGGRAHANHPPVHDTAAVPQVYVSAANKTRTDTPPTPSVVPLLALLRGGGGVGANGSADKAAALDNAPENAVASAMAGFLPLSPSQRPQSGSGLHSPVHDGGIGGTLPLRERVLRLSQDQVGCRMLQAIVDAEMTGAEPPAVLFTSSVAIQQLLDVLMPDLATVMSDSYGNFLIQKIFDVAPPETRKRLLRESTLSTQLAAVACSCHGTFAVQRLIETMSDEEEEALVKAALRQSTMQLLVDVNGGHVISKWLAYMTQRYGGLLSSLASHTAVHHHAETMRGVPSCAPVTDDHAPCPSVETPAAVTDAGTELSTAAALARKLHEKTDFLFDGILANLMTVCLNRQGCCIVQKTCDYWSSMSLPAPLSLPDAYATSTCGDGAAVPRQQTPVRAVQDAVLVSRTSNSLQRFVVALLDHVLELAVDPFGNYVLTHAVKLCYVKGYLQLVDAIAGCLLQPQAESVAGSVQSMVRLCRNKFASNVVEQVLRLCGEKRVRAFCRLMLWTPSALEPHGRSDRGGSAPHANASAATVSGRTFLEPIAWNSAHADPHAEASMKTTPGPHDTLPLLTIALDAYGNYVVQTLLTVAPVSELIPGHGSDASRDDTPEAGAATVGILPILQEALPRLRDKNFGRKMETKLGLAQLRASQAAK